MERALRALLNQSAAIIAICPDTRIVWGRLGQGKALPAAVMTVIDNVDGLTMQGSDGLWRGRVQIDCYGATYAAALDLAEAMIGVLHGHRAGSFRLIVLAGRRDYDESSAADRPSRVSLDFITNWRAGDAG